MDFAALMSKAKVNTQQQREAATAKQRELEVQQKLDAEREKVLQAKEEERRRKEAEAKLKREAAQREIEAKLRIERERKRLEKIKLDETAKTQAASTTGVRKPSVPGATTKAALPSTLVRKKRKKIDAMFSDDDEAPSDASASRKSTSSKHKLGPGTSPSKRTAGSSSNLANLSAKDRLKAEFNPNDAQALNVVKRDTRSIDEIESDLRRKKELANGGPSAPVATSAGFFAGRKGAAIAIKGTAAASLSSTASTTAPIARPSSASMAKSASLPTVPKQPSTTAPPAQPLPPVKKHPKAKRESLSPPPPPRPAREPERKKAKKRASSYSPPPRASDDAARRQEIWSIINPNKSYGRHQSYDYASDAIDEDSDDMEAGMDEIEEEDRMADRIAKREDKAELLRQEQRAQEKEDARKRKEGGGPKKANKK